MVKNPPVNAGDLREAGSIPGSGRCPGGGHRNPPQDSCLEDPVDRGTWRATVHGVAKSQTRLKRLSRPTSYLKGNQEMHLGRSQYTKTQGGCDTGASWLPARTGLRGPRTQSSEGPSHRHLRPQDLVRGRSRTRPSGGAASSFLHCPPPLTLILILTAKPAPDGQSPGRAARKDVYGLSCIKFYF